MIERIVTNVLQELNWCTPSKDFKDLVGLEAHVSNLNSMLYMDSNEVKMIGIWGPAGIGKTTIARALYNQLSSSGDDFQLNLFMENVKGIHRRNELHGYSLKLHLQERFLSEIFNQRTKISHLGVAQERLKNQKALIILDDVDGLEQLNALVDQAEWFGYGTIIVVTTEDRQLLKAHGINHVYEVGYPSQGEAFKILCRYAFGKNSAPKGFYDLATEVTKLAGDLPLGLSVLVCYDGLDEKDKALFLHVACLFNGEKVDRVKQLLAKSALDAEYGLRVLVDRSLIHIYADGCIVMHFLLQQIGKEIIRGQCINDPGKRQFLVDAQEISDVLVDETGTKNVLGISLDMSELDDEVYISEKAFKKMTNLQFLRLYNHFPDEAVKLHLPHGLDYLPRKLRLLHWDSYPIKCMPSKFRPEYLVELTLRDSKLEKLWEGAQPLTGLRHMDLSSSKNIKDIPNLSGAMNLEKLYLRFCENLVTVSSSSLQNLNKLKVLDMSCCTKLKALPTNINLESLSVLNLRGCSKLKRFPCISTQVQFMSLGETAIEKALPTNINLESLSVLNLRGCSKLKRFPCISTQVQFMSLGETAIEKVPSLIRLCSRLVSLEMAGCKNLKTLPPVPASIEILDLSKKRVEASEAQMISKIVKDVSNELPSTDFDRLVGVEAHVAKLISMIRLECDAVKMVGIWGPAGIGKTTIAKALYNQVSSNFQLKFYKEIFKGKYEVHNLERYDLQNRLKKELLSGVLDHRDMKIPDLGEAEERLKHQRVLLILDDVFLHDLKGLRDVIQGLRYGSKVIVTSEDIDTLRECGIHQNQTYRVAFPSSEEVLQIISYSAFGQRFPPRSYLEHADEVAKLVSPFPLGLRVIGSSLRGKSKDEWITALAKLKTCHGDKDVETAIRFAYEGLSDKQKTLLYLLTDSISSGENVNNAIFSLSQSDWDAEKGIQTLADIAFITISGEGRILMHYL
ncbi:hypothetical protein F2Q70_00014452, partial [Brassica cretica]